MTGAGDDGYDVAGPAVPQAGVPFGKPDAENVRQVSLELRVTRDQPEKVVTPDLDRPDVAR
jgi:hypothetical protein